MTSATAERPGLARGGAYVAVGMGLAQVLVYALYLVLSRTFSPAEYGSVAAILGLVLVGSVPAMALQAMVARQAASEPGPGTERVAVSYGVWVGGGTGLLVVLLSPVLAPFLRLDSVTLVLLAAASLAPFALTSAAQGLLQGTEQFRRLAVVFVATAALRLALGGGGALLLGVTGALAGTAVAAVLAAGLALALSVRRADLGSLARPRGRWRELGRVVLAIGGLLVLANTDVLLARHYLPAAVAGLYAVGALVARATFWAPQFVSVSVFSRLTDPAYRRQLLPRAAALVLGIGGLATLATALIARPMLTAVFGQRYALLAPTLWWFALMGSLQALAQLLTVSGIASADRLTPFVVWSGVVLQLVLVATVGHGSLQAVAVSVTAAAALTAAALALRAVVTVRYVQRPAVVGGLAHD